MLQLCPAVFKKPVKIVANLAGPVGGASAFAKLQRDAFFQRSRSDSGRFARLQGLNRAADIGHRRFQSCREFRVAAGEIAVVVEVADQRLCQLADISGQTLQHQLLAQVSGQSGFLGNS